MNIKKVFTILCSFIISAVIPSFVCYADNNNNLIQTYINAYNIDLFTSESFNSESLTVKVANKSAEITDSGLISDKEIAIQTVILTDISVSMPIESRGNVLELIQNKIKNIEKNEKIKIVTFGNETKVIQDFTSDRYDLSNAASEIEFNGTQSALYDTVFNTLPEIKTDGENPCFYRTIVITDGADFTPGGITKEELFMRLQKETYPIDVVCVSANAPQNQDKDLAALTRISGGRYFELLPESDTSALASDLSAGNYFWIRAKVPAELLDGSTRQVDISDGGSSISFDMKMSVVDEQIEETLLTEQTDITSDTVESAETSVISSSFGDTLTGLFPEKAVPIVVAAGAALMVAVVIIIAVNKKKKNKANTRQPVQGDSYNDPCDGGDETEAYTEEASEEHFAVKISNTDRPSENWIVEVIGDVLIGRGENCKIKINDKSVSREQCKIAAVNGGLAVINLSESNITKLNGTAVSDERLLHPGDGLKLGRVTLRVDYIQKTGEELPRSHDTQNNPRSGDTESIF